MQRKIGNFMKPENITVLVDTREKEKNYYKLEYAPGKVLKHETATLYTGDYTIKGLENHVAIERKSLDDLMGCIGQHRERFQKEVDRLRGFEVKALVVETDWQTIAEGRYRSRVKSSAALGSLMGWIAQGIPVIMADNHERAGIFVARILYVTARRRLGELKALGSI